MKECYCEICGRKYDGSHHSIHYCRKHELQLKKYGKFLDSNPRNKFDPNEFRFIGNNTVEFDTYNQITAAVTNTFLIDAEDYPLVSKFKWKDTKNKWGMPYAVAKCEDKIIQLHRFIMDAKPGQQVDHINLNSLDNRKANLRIADNSLNSSNRRPYNKLGVKGVEYHAKEDKYSAYFRINDKQYHSPCYKTKEEAAFARFILEQMFRKESLTQFSTDLINTLSVEQKQNVIDSVKKKFNKE